MLGGACTYFYIKYKQEKQVTFASRVDETKKRYKNGVEDLKKAQWYLNKLIEVYDDKS